MTGPHEMGLLLPPSPASAAARAAAAAAPHGLAMGLAAVASHRGHLLANHDHHHQDHIAIPLGLMLFASVWVLAILLALA